MYFIEEDYYFGLLLKYNQKHHLLVAFTTNCCKHQYYSSFNSTWSSFQTSFIQIVRSEIACCLLALFFTRAFFCLFFGATLAILRNCSWFWTKELLVVLEEPYGISKIEPRSDTCKEASDLLKYHCCTFRHN